jgi:glyoxylase-like metal-dependent hydrolase (beta-lactamase superfamily II)
VTAAGQAVAVATRVRRVLAPNSSAMTGPGTNTYVVGARPPYTVVDPGPAGDDHLAAVLAAAPEVGTIVVTHTHGDHSPGAAPLAEATGAAIAGFGPMLRPGVESHDDTFRPDRTLADGDVVEGPDHRLVALHTPGHASNHLCFLLESSGERVLFTGDHVMQGSTVVIAPLDGDMADYVTQLERIKRLAVDRLLPGHGDPIDDPDAYLQAYLDHRADRTEKILAALTAAGPSGATCVQLVEQAYTDVASHLHPIAVHSVWASLRATPEASTDTPDDPAALWRVRPPNGEGGEPPCWLDKVCESCGALLSDGEAHACRSAAGSWGDQ